MLIDSHCHLDRLDLTPYNGSLDALLDAAFEVVERHIGVVSIVDCDVLRAERF